MLNGDELRRKTFVEHSAFMLPSAATVTMSYRRLKCPTAIIAGRDDEIVDSEQAVRLQKAMPHAAITLVPETGHMVHYFVADQIVKIARNYAAASSCATSGSGSHCSQAINSGSINKRPRRRVARISNRSAN
jgi:pimeloyl-ACP methyl ester carboxylesterase